MTRLSRFSLAVVAFVLVSLAAGSARAEEEYLRFLHALQARGFGELALVYLDRITARSDTPAEIKQIIDLERCNSLRVAAGREAYNADVAKKRLEEAKKLLDKFLQENPNHPAVSGAVASAGDFAIERAQQKLIQAKIAKDAKEKEKVFEEVRTLLKSDAEPAFLRANDLFKTRFKELLAKLPKASEVDQRDRKAMDKFRQATTAKEEAELGLVESRYKLAMIKYYLSETYEDPKNATRVKLLKDAGREFDGIFQAYRGMEPGVLAHSWHAKCLEDLGDFKGALDLYDEVMVNEPDLADATEEQAAMFAQVMLFRLRVVLKASGMRVYAAEANEWLKMHKPWQRVPAYSGIALEYLKAKFAAAEKATGDDQRRLLREILGTLTPLVKVESDFKNELVRLHAEVLKKLGGKEADSVDLVAADVHKLAEEGKLDEAAVKGVEALKKYDPTKQASQIAEMQRFLRQIRYRQGIALFSSGKYDETVKLVAPLIQEDPKDPATPQLASLGVSALLQLYIASLNKPEAEKAAALKKLEDAANFTMNKWPSNPEGDEARLAVGQARRARGDLESALEVYEKVNPNSKRYGSALQLAGQTYFQIYAMKKRAGNPKDKPKLPEYLTKVQERLTASIEFQKKNAREGESMTRQMLETQLLLGEAVLESGDPAKAIPLLDPVVDEIQKSKIPIDSVVTRAYFATVTAHKNNNDIEKAGDVASLLLGTGADSASINGLMIGVVRTLEKEVQQGEAKVIESKNATEKEAAQKKLDKAKEVYTKLLDQLATRQELTTAQIVWLGDACKTVGTADNGMWDKAVDLYKRVLAKRDDEAFKSDPNNAKALVRVYAQMAGILRDKGQFAEATQAIEAPIKSHPNALEPLMEKGRILQAWSMKDHSKFAESANHWADLRIRLGRMAKKPKEYYEVMYNCAYSVAADALVTKDKTKAAQAEQLLKATMVLSPELSGPDMVARYNELLKKIKAIQDKVGAGAAASASSP